MRYCLKRSAVNVAFRDVGPTPKQLPQAVPISTNALLAVSKEYNNWRGC